MFSDRLKTFHPNYQACLGILEDKLKAIAPGSILCILPWMDRDIIALLEHGRLMDGTPIYKRGIPSHCHENVDELCESNPNITPCTGYGLSEDGLWREHSWGFEVKRGKKRIIETTLKRLAYFGVSLPTQALAVL